MSGGVALLDTNLLLLYLAGEIDTSLLRNFKRLQGFQINDLELLTETLRPFKQLLTTPHVLTETSNFVDHAPLYRRKDMIRALRRFAESNEERYEAAVELMRQQSFSHLGLADAGLVFLSRVATVVTVDNPLAYAINTGGGSVINFNAVRGEGIFGV